VGHTLKNPELAQVLRKIAAQGSKGLLEGDVAQAIVDKVQKPPGQPRPAEPGRPGRLPAQKARADLP
jgi:gamma-glutamyltranspeptidase